MSSRTPRAWSSPRRLATALTWLACLICCRCRRSRMRILTLRQRPSPTRTRRAMLAKSLPMTARARLDKKRCSVFRHCFTYGSRLLVPAHSVVVRSIIAIATRSFNNDLHQCVSLAWHQKEHMRTRRGNDVDHTMNGRGCDADTTSSHRVLTSSLSNIMFSDFKFLQHYNQAGHNTSRRRRSNWSAPGPSQLALGQGHISASQLPATCESVHHAKTFANCQTATVLQCAGWLVAKRTARRNICSVCVCAMSLWAVGLPVT
jgi:hypothetical protein